MTQSTTSHLERQAEEIGSWIDDLRLIARFGAFTAPLVVAALLLQYTVGERMAFPVATLEQAIATIGIGILLGVFIIVYLGFAFLLALPMRPLLLKFRQEDERRLGRTRSMVVARAKWIEEIVMAVIGKLAGLSFLVIFFTQLRNADAVADTELLPFLFALFASGAILNAAVTAASGVNAAARRVAIFGSLLMILLINGVVVRVQRTVTPLVLEMMTIRSADTDLIAVNDDAKRMFERLALTNALPVFCALPGHEEEELLWAAPGGRMFWRGFGGPATIRIPTVQDGNEPANERATAIQLELPSDTVHRRPRLGLGIVGEPPSPCSAGGRGAG